MRTRTGSLVVFYVLACLFGWSIFIAHLLGAPVEVDNMPLGPIAAAAIVTAFSGEFRAWGRRLLRWRTSPSWYAVAVLTPIVIDAGIILVNHLFGAPLPSLHQLAGWPSVAGNFVIMLVMVGIGEEAGWSAFAAPRLLERHRFVTTWLVMSAMRIFWHLPLIVSGMLPWTLGIVGNAGFQAIVLWMLRESDGRWPLVAVWHTTLNVVGGQFLFQMVDGADHARLGVMMSLTYAALGAALVHRRRITARRVTPLPEPALAGQRRAAGTTPQGTISTTPPPGTAAPHADAR